MLPVALRILSSYSKIHHSHTPLVHNNMYSTVKHGCVFQDSFCYQCGFPDMSYSSRLQVLLFQLADELDEAFSYCLHVLQRRGLQNPPLPPGQGLQLKILLYLQEHRNTSIFNRTFCSLVSVPCQY